MTGGKGDANVDVDVDVFPHDRVLGLRLRSKLGQKLDKEDLKFLTNCWKRWPHEYAALDQEIRQAAYRHVTGQGETS